MITKNDDFNKYVNQIALWCPDGCDGTDLAAYAEYALSNKISDISVDNYGVGNVWAWLENKFVKTSTRFFLGDIPGDDFANRISELTVKINNSFKQGAGAAAVFVDICNLDDFVSDLISVRDDLFFNKDFYLGLDINTDFSLIFDSMRKLNASLLLAGDLSDKNDENLFLGRVYGLLNEWDFDDNFKLHFVLNCPDKYFIPVKRLVEKIQPGLINRIKFFITH